MNWLLMIFLALACSKDPVVQDATNAPADSTRPVVKTKSIERRTVKSNISVSATLEAVQTAVLLPKSAGRVAEVPVRIGQSVAAGRLLMRVEPADYSYGLQDAKGLQAVAAAQLAQAEVNLERFRQLAADGSATQAQLEEIETGVQLAQAQLMRAEAAVGIAQARLRDTELKAPFAGTVIARNVEVGELVGGPANQPPLMLADTSKMRAVASISEQMSTQIQVGLPVRITVPAVPNYQATGQIELINAAVDPVTRTVAIELSVDNAAGVLKHGMSALLSFESVEDAQTMVPRQALFERSNGSAQIYVLEGDSVVQRQVRYAPSTEDFVPVLEGASEGDKVVVAGLSRLKDGMQVKEQSE